MALKLEGLTIVLTGGTSGIGREMVELLAPANTLVVLGRDAEKLSDVVKEFPAADTVLADLANTNSIMVAAEKITEKYGNIDVLINNAAMQYEPRFTDPDFDPGMIQREIDVNFTNVCYLTYALLPALTKTSRSVILNIGSGLGLAAKPASAIYCASKGALNIFSQSLRYQLEDTNISVQQALLPMVETPMTAGRGSGKISARDAASRILAGLSKGVTDNDIGKVKLLRRMLRIAPSIAFNIMRKS